jgi:hypothetical protein
MGSGTVSTDHWASKKLSEHEILLFLGMSLVTVSAWLTELRRLSYPSDMGIHPP